MIKIIKQLVVVLLVLYIFILQIPMIEFSFFVPEKEVEERYVLPTEQVTKEESYEDKINKLNRYNESIAPHIKA